MRIKSKWKEDEVNDCNHNDFVNDDENDEEEEHYDKMESNEENQIQLPLQVACEILEVKLQSNIDLSQNLGMLELNV